MGNGLTLQSPEIQETIKMLRKKAGYETQVEKTIGEYKKEIDSLKYRLNYLEKQAYNRDIVYNRELARAQDFLRMLTTVRGKDLKRAVALVIYWDKFSWISCDIVERMCAADSRVKELFSLPRHFGYITSMRKCVGTKAFADALKAFGYGKGAKERSRDKGVKSKKRKAKATQEVDVEVS